MSYEGYVQALCARGHLYVSGAPECPVCGAPTAWVNHVDDTNLDQYGVILDWSSLEREEVDGTKVYDIPCEGGPEVPPRYYWDNTSQQYLRIVRP